MDSLKKEIIGGFNAFVDDQKKVPGKATLTLVQFDNIIDRLASFKPLAEVEPLTDKTYEPRGSTKLYDAIGLTVKTTKEEISKATEKPEKVLVLILTDGLENSSEEYTTESIKALLEAQQKEGWEFSFIGANQDAVLAAQGIGLHNAASNITFAANAAGSNGILRSMSNATAMYRCAPQGAQFAYSATDRATQNAAGLDPSSVASFTHKAVFAENGSKAGTLGGPARSASLTPRQRSSIARTAAKARWSNSSK